MANSVITLDNVSFRYPDAGRDALSGVSLSIEAGSFIAVLGHNGSGKSTLAKLLNAILVPTEGTVTVKGMDTRSEENLLNVRRTVGMVFQNPDNQIVASVVEDDVAFAPENLGVSPAEIRRRVDEALKRVGMYEFRNNAPHLLSGGQKQRVAIAGVLAMQPEILVMDEPTAMLDPSGRQEVLRTIADLRAATGVTVVLITHHMDECIDADRLLVMSDGKLVLDGAPKDVFSRVEQMRSIGLDVPATTETLYEPPGRMCRLARSPTRKPPMPLSAGSEIKSISKGFSLCPISVWSLSGAYTAPGLRLKRSLSTISISPSLPVSMRRCSVIPAAEKARSSSISTDF